MASSKFMPNPKLKRNGYKALYTEDDSSTHFKIKKREEM